MPDQISNVFNGRQHWKIIREVLDPDTQDVINQRWVADVDNEDLIQMLINANESVDPEKGPNVKYFVKFIPGIDTITNDTNQNEKDIQEKK